MMFTVLYRPEDDCRVWAYTDEAVEKYEFAYNYGITKVPVRVQ